ncbi:MAG: WGR domain-containing protein [Mesorhizobium sp.]|nr:MAG: WGR domain-containing protein [Mesorhizobium sp.]
MSSYPIKATHLSLDHRGGTKSYHTVLVETADGLGLLVKRWGKKGVFGSTKTESYATYREAERAFERIFNEKTRGGYEVVGKTVETVANDQSELPKMFGRMIYSKLDSGALQHIDPTIDVTGRREPDPPEYDENGDYIGRAPPRVIPRETIEAALKREAEERKQKEQEGYAANPLFGLF